MITLQDFDSVTTEFMLKVIPVDGELDTDESVFEYRLAILNRLIDNGRIPKQANIYYDLYIDSNLYDMCDIYFNPRFLTKSVCILILISMSDEYIIGDVQLSDRNDAISQLVNVLNISTININVFATVNDFTKTFAKRVLSNVIMSDISIARDIMSNIYNSWPHHVYDGICIGLVTIGTEDAIDIACLSLSRLYDYTSYIECLNIAISTRNKDIVRCINKYNNIKIVIDSLNNKDRKWITKIM